MNRVVLCKMNKLLLLSFLILMIGIPSAYAHPFLLDSEPGQAENAPVGTTQIVTYYSEAIEIDFSELKCLTVMETKSITWTLHIMMEKILL